MMLDMAPLWTPEVQQQNYRTLLEAMSRPGQVKPILWQKQDLRHRSGWGDRCSDTAMAVLATLIDGEVSLADPDRLLAERDWLPLQAKSAEPALADYILCKGDSAPEFEPKLGTLSSPEQSATILIQVESLTNGTLNLKVHRPWCKRLSTCLYCRLEPRMVDLS